MKIETTLPGQAMRLLRTREGASLAQVARLIGVAPITVARWENGTSIPGAGDLASYLVEIGASAVEQAEVMGLFGSKNVK